MSMCVCVCVCVCEKEISCAHAPVCVCVCVCVSVCPGSRQRAQKVFWSYCRGVGGVSEAFPFSALAHHSFCNFRTFQYLFSVLRAGG